MACGKTITARPLGVSRGRRSQPFTTLLGMWYALGLSRRGIEVMAGLLGYGVAQVTSWREMQRLGRAVGRRLPAGLVRIRWWTRLGCGCAAKPGR